MNAFTLTFLVLLVLKLAKLADIGWFWVWLPLWSGLIIFWLACVDAERRKRK
jgi:hypothetical protein